MARRMIWLAVLAGWLVLPATPASARLLPDWPYEKLVKEADLVVVAVAKSTEDTADEPADPDVKQNRWFIGQTSTLSVRATLKGKAAEEIKVMHFRLNKAVVEDIVGGPTLVEFRTGGASIKVKGHTKVMHNSVQYLLFLKARKDGRYEPVSGEYDPSQAVRELYPATDPGSRK